MDKISTSSVSLFLFHKNFHTRKKWNEMSDNWRFSVWNILKDSVLQHWNCLYNEALSFAPHSFHMRKKCQPCPAGCVKGNFLQHKASNFLKWGIPMKLLALWSPFENTQRTFEYKFDISGPVHFSTIQPFKKVSDHNISDETSLHLPCNERSGEQSFQTQGWCFTVYRKKPYMWVWVFAPVTISCCYGTEKRFFLLSGDYWRGGPKHQW